MIAKHETCPWCRNETNNFYIDMCDGVFVGLMEKFGCPECHCTWTNHMCIDIPRIQQEGLLEMDEREVGHEDLRRHRVSVADRG